MSAKTRAFSAKVRKLEGMVRRPPRKLNRRQKREVKQIVSRRQEQKHLDFTTLATTDQPLDRAFTNFNAINITQIGQNIGVQNRIGDSLRPKQLQIRYKIYYNGSLVSYNTTHTARVVIIKWNDSDTAFPPTAAAVFQNVTSGAGDYSPVISPFNWQALKQKDFVVVYDRTHSVGGSSMGVAVKRKIKCRGSMEFDTAASTGAGQYFLFAVADDVTGGTTPNLIMGFYSRLIYTDS